MKKIMKLKIVVLMLVMMSALMLATFSEAPVVSVRPPVPAPDGPFEKYGPRVNMLIFHVSGGVTQEAADFKAGLIDIMDWAAPAEEWDDWLDDPSIMMGDFGEFAPIYLALNTMRWPLGHGDQFPEGWTSYPSGYFYGSGHSSDLWSGDPTKSDLPIGTADMTYVDYTHCQRCNDTRWFRRGLAHMVDRAAQVAYMQGAGRALERTLFWPAFSSWENPNAPKYDYDLIAARACFEEGGFKDWDNDGKMEYSPGHNGVVVEDLPVLQFYTRVDDDHRTHLGQMISGDMTLLGVPHVLYIATYGTVATKVWAEYDYDIYIEYWPWDPLPNFYAEWFMTEMDIYPLPWGNNEHRYHNKEFDQAAENFMTATTPEDIKYWCNQMQFIIHRDVVAIPCYAYVGYNAHRTYYGTWPGDEKYAGTPWEGICNYPGEGFYCYSGVWSFLNAYPQGFEKGGTLRMGLNINPDLLDIMDSIYFYEGLVLQQIYERLLKFNPWDLTKYEPWLCSDFKTGTWEHPTEGTCSAVNFTLIPGVLWQDGVPMNASDVEFSFWFTRECKSVFYSAAKDYNSSVIYPNTPEPGKETIEIRFNILSWLATYWCQSVPIIPRHIWAPVGVSGSPAYNPEEHDTVIGTGPFRFYKDKVVGRVNRVPGEYVYLEPNPLYFRKYIWPDVCDADGNLPGDEQVTGMDFAVVAYPINIFVRENPDGTWPPGTWGEPCDVNKDGKIGVGDLMEIGVNYGDPWPPAYYEW